MKVRIAGDKIRFRLRQQEVREMLAQGFVSETLQLGDGPHEQLQFNLQLHDGNHFTIDSRSGTTTVFIPRRAAASLADADKVGLEESITAGTGRSVSLLIEKDFKCLDGREEDNEGTYPNPKEAC